jgi:hypothetical protein
LDVGVPVCTCTADLCGGVCCDSGTNCVDGACKGPSALGGVCSDADPCAVGLFCIPNAANPNNGADASAGYCEECHPGVAGAVCGGDDYCDASGEFGVCKACACGGNEVCDPVGGACSCPNVTCGAACCAAGMVCSNGSCVECAGTSDCMSGEICQNNVCVGVQCISDAMCDVEAGQHCDETTHACACVNETCGAGTAKVCCAAGEVCDSSGGCAVACAKDKDCAKGEHCDTKLGYCVANECAKDADCASSEVCTDGTCAAGEGQSGGGEEGNGGGKGENGGESGGNGATQLPNTGVGRGASGSSSWLGAAMVGGAAALLAGKKLRQNAAPADVE